MPVSEEEEPRRRPLLTVLFWTGVGLAPLAMLLLLFADGNGLLRVAAVLAVLAVVLIGLSIGLRGDPEAVRVDIEDMIADEIEGLHRDVRKDVETAARATHRAFGERLRAVQGSVDQLRTQVEALRAEARRGVPPSTFEPVGGPADRDTPGYARAGTTYGAGRDGTPYGREAVAGYGPEAGVASGREAGLDGYGQPAGAEPAFAGAGRAAASSGAAYGGHAAGGGPSGGGHGYSGGARHGAGSYGGATYGALAEGFGGDGRDSATPPGAPRPPRARVPGPRLPGGVVRHTETVQVTTRHTIVDGRGDESADVYGDAGPYRDVSSFGDVPSYGEGPSHGDDPAYRNAPPRREGDTYRDSGTYHREATTYRGGGTPAHPGRHADSGDSRSAGAASYHDSGDYRTAGTASYHDSGDYRTAGAASYHDSGDYRSAGTAGYQDAGAHRAGTDYRAAAGVPGGRAGRHHGEPTAGTGNVYGGRRHGADDQPAPWPEPRPAAITRGDDDPWSAYAAPEGRAVPAYDERWSAAGDRWAEVRADDRGRELRMGERRASVRADETGTHLRVEDRWAAVRDDGAPAWSARDYEFERSDDRWR